MLRKLIKIKCPWVGQTKIFYSVSDAWKKFATIDPWSISGAQPGRVQNLVGGVWKDASDMIKIEDPMNGELFLSIPDTKGDELTEFRSSAEKCPKSGLHNPLKNPERYNMYGEVLRKIANLMHEKDVEEFFIKLIQRVAPKSDVQAKAELAVTRTFLSNFSGDQPRFLCRSFNVSGDHQGQQSTGYRYPYGPVMIIAPFNFPLEIPVLQMVGALITGNKVTMKPAERVCAVVEQFIRAMIYCGMPAEDVDLLNSTGKNTEALITSTHFRMTQFTGSSAIANKLAVLLKGKIKVEDAGFDWKILGPDVKEFEYCCWVSDQDAYAFSGQKCSAQSILFAHENWVQAGVFDKLKELASRRKLEDLTICPVLTWNNKRIQEHIDNLLKIEGAYVAIGGKPLTNHTIPEIFGSFEPTAVYVPLKQIMKEENFHLVTKELFGPFQILTSFSDGELDDVLQILEKMENHLTAAVVSSDPIFLGKVLGSTVNGTTYAGLRARTTGAPQNHWFGPSGDPRGAGIGSPEGILSVWTAHREIIQDQGPIPKGWTLPKAS